MDIALLTDKLLIPALAGNPIPRPRLLGRLEAELRAGRRITAVCAPAGWGKSTLLATWAAQERRPVAWITLDAGDSDPARFWRYVVAAIRQVRPGFGATVADAIRHPTWTDHHAIPILVLNELVAARLPEPMLLVLDNLHDVDCADLLDSLTYFLQHLPPTVHVAFTSRSEPAVPLARLRAQGRLHEVTAADLRFTPDEAARFFTNQMGLRLDADHIETLTERTEGWVTGLQLAGLSLRDRSDARGLINGFSGGHRAVTDYLKEEVLGRIPEDRFDFLMETSFLPMVKGTLADAVRERSDSQAMLQDVVRAGLFLVPLDDERHAYRYHQLFADLLQRKLRDHRTPDQIREYHRRASAHFLRYNMIVEAVDLLLHAPDLDGAITLIEHHADQMVWSCGEVLTVRRWLDHLPDERVRPRPRLLALHAWTRALTGQLELAEARLADADVHLTATDSVMAPDDARILTGEIAAIQARIATLRDLPEEAIRASRRALATLPEAFDHLRADIGLNLGFALLAEGKLDDADTAFHDAREMALRGDNRRAALLAIRYMLWMKVHRGRPREALAGLVATLTDAEERGWGAHPAVGLLHVGMSEIHFQRDEHSDARHALRTGLAMGERGGEVKVLVTGQMALAQLRQAERDFDGAAASLDSAERLLPGRPVAAARARLALARGDLPTATAWALSVERDQRPYTLVNDTEYWILAQVLIETGHAERALALTEHMILSARREDRMLGEIAHLTIKALALRALDREHEALTTLRDALRLAEPEQLARGFLDADAPMRHLIEVLVERTDPESNDRDHDHDPAVRFARWLLTRWDQPSRAEQNGAVSTSHHTWVHDLPEPLTPREREVLDLLTQGLSNQAIADELSVSVGTVKTHLHRAYAKLGVRTRTEALAWTQAQRDVDLVSVTPR